MAEGDGHGSSKIMKPDGKVVSWFIGRIKGRHVFKPVRTGNFGYTRISEQYGFHIIGVKLAEALLFFRFVALGIVKIGGCTQRKGVFVFFLR